MKCPNCVDGFLDDQGVELTLSDDKRILYCCGVLGESPLLGFYLSDI